MTSCSGFWMMSKHVCLAVLSAKTFDDARYPRQLKQALCCHPRVSLLYSVGKEIKVHQKGGEADDALLRALLDFHSGQLAANRRGLAVLLSGDADFCNVLDVMRVAGHKVMLYHSPAVARNLLSNCDLHEAWLDFLVRKSLTPVPSLLGTASPASVAGLLPPSAPRLLAAAKTAMPSSASRAPQPVLLVQRTPGNSRRAAMTAGHSATPARLSPKGANRSRPSKQGAAGTPSVSRNCTVVDGFDKSDSEELVRQQAAALCRPFGASTIHHARKRSGQPFAVAVFTEEGAARNAVSKLSDAPAGNRTMRYFVGDAFEYLERHAACSRGSHAANGNATVQQHLSQTAPLTEVQQSSLLLRTLCFIMVLGYVTLLLLGH